MKAILIILVAALSGCASQYEPVSKQEQANTIFQYDTSYCMGEGFKIYSEYENFVSFVCSDKKRFIIRK